MPISHPSIKWGLVRLVQNGFTIFRRQNHVSALELDCWASFHVFFKNQYFAVRLLSAEAYVDRPLWVNDVLLKILDISVIKRKYSD